MLILENVKSVLKKLPILHYLKEITVYSVFCLFFHYECMYSYNLIHVIPLFVHINVLYSFFFLNKSRIYSESPQKSQT